ncbi:unnamed protein product [Arabidopsis thaliana]|uniref:DUF4283 domain-containing protein n=2 Tax=Arabidopsis thaliana TaxID=3702 RepID=A0A654F3I7_ARATH|nr:unnamed protein product [Arabidopsis thaliana]
MERAHCNRGASDIATSVITGFRFQSYVARGYPLWMTMVLLQRESLLYLNFIFFLHTLSNMADKLWDEIQNLELGPEDPTLFIPHEAYVMVAETNRLSIIARPLNPRVQNLYSVIAALPRSWGLTTHVHGRVLDATYVQFLFHTEMDLVSVQRREPWLFNNRFVASQRWEPAPALNFVTTIDLLVQMRGIPLPYVYEETALEIAQEIGEIISLDFHDATSTQIAYIRVRVQIGITERLRVPAPPLNPEELAGASPYFPSSRNAAFQPYMVPSTQGGVGRHHVFPDSNINPSSGAAITSGVRRVYEVGESFRPCPDGESRNNRNIGESSKRKNLVILQSDNEKAN